jgi:hypothetical protein
MPSCAIEREANPATTTIYPSPKALRSTLRTLAHFGKGGRGIRYYRLMIDIRSAFVNDHSSRAQLTAVAAVLAFALMGASALSVDDAAAASKRPAGSVKLTGSLQKSVGKIRCGKIRGSWLPGTKLTGGYFISHTQQATNYKKLASRAKGKARTKNLKTAASFRGKASSQLKSCRATTPPPTPTPTPTPANQLRFSIAGAAGLALKATAGASSHASKPGAHAAATGSNLQTITSTGAVVDAVSSGVAGVKRFFISPAGKTYIVFKEVVDLTTGDALWSIPDRVLAPNSAVQPCILAEVSPESAIPKCVEGSDIPTWRNHQSTIEIREVKFDTTGAVYYSGLREDGQQGGQILRRYDGTSATDLIYSGSVRIDDFIPLPNGGVIMTGSTTSSGLSWTRRVSADGSIGTLFNDSATSLSRFADGNIYIGSSGRVRRYLAASNQLDARSWISSGNEASPYFSTGEFCTGEVLRVARLGFCGSSGAEGVGFFNTTDGKTFALAGSTPNGTLTQYYPTIAFPTTSVKNIAVVQGVITNLILAGTDASNQNIMTIYDTSNGVETRLLGSENDIEIYHVNYVADGNKVLFDGLRFSDNKYVLGQVDLATKQVSVTSTIPVKWSDFQTFG